MAGSAILLASNSPSMFTVATQGGFMLVPKTGYVSSNLDGAGRPDDSKPVHPPAGADAPPAAGAGTPSPMDSSSTPPADEQAESGGRGWHMVSLWQWIMLAVVFIGPLIVLIIYGVFRY